jgi:hypothetical protein
VILGNGKIIQSQDLPHAVRRCGKIIPAPPESADRPGREEDEKKTLHLYEN